MMVHFKNALVADGAVMGSRWFWLDTFLADAHSLWDEATFGWIARWYSQAHIVVETNIN